MDPKYVISHRKEGTQQQKLMGPDIYETAWATNKNWWDHSIKEMARLDRGYTNLATPA
jgi:hypothetical protein